MTNNLMNQQCEGLRILSVSGDNFKKLTNVNLVFGGKSFLISGPNAIGKSSLIQMLMSPMDKKVLPTDPIKRGEEKANIVLTIGGTLHGTYEEYTLELLFSQAKKTGRLVVRNQNGEEMKTPTTFVDSLIGNVSFDIMRWLTLPPKQKLEIIKDLTGASQQIDSINLNIQNKKTEYSAKKNRAEDLEAVMKNHNFTPEQIDLYSTPAPLEALQDEMNNISVAQQEYDGVVNQMNRFQSDITRGYADIEREQNEIKELENKIQQKRDSIQKISDALVVLNDNIKIGNNWFTLGDGTIKQRPSVDDVNFKINNAIRHNENHGRIRTLSDQQREMIEAKQAMDTIKSEIEGLEKSRSEVISASQLPVTGLTFDNEQIFLDGLPVEEEQINTARLFDVGMEIAMAMHPNLKTIFLKQGSLIDNNNMLAMLKKAEDKGYQVIAEMVDSENGALEIKFTESLIKPSAQ